MLKGMCCTAFGVVLTATLMGFSPDQSEEQRDNPTYQEESPEAAHQVARQLDSAAIQECIAGAPQGPPPLARKIDHAYMAMPMSTTDEQAYQILARRFGVPPDTVEAIITRATMAIGGSNTGEVRAAVECIARLFGEIYAVIVSGDFANISYVHTSFTAWSAEDVRDPILRKMPSQLEALFEIPSLERVRLTARYPAIDKEGRAAGSLRVALVEVRRNEFERTRDVRTYPGFTPYGEWRPER